MAELRNKFLDNSPIMVAELKKIVQKCEIFVKNLEAKIFLRGVRKLLNRKVFLEMGFLLTSGEKRDTI